MNESDSEGEEGWMESEDTVVSASCPFCHEVMSSAELIWAHVKRDHGFDLLRFLSDTKSDCYGYIKFVNFVRNRKCNIDQLNLFTIGEEPFPWSDDKFLAPVIPDDPLLQFDVEAYGDNFSSVDSKETIKAQQDRIEQLEQALAELRYNVQRLLVNPSAETTGSGDTSSGKADETSSYFESYAHYGIHEDMLKDEVRTDSYRRAILTNADRFKHASVLDVGCGTAILSLFAAEAGARSVLAVDFSDIAFSAMDIVRENNADNVVTVKHCRVEDVELAEKVDVVISEWMGYFLLFECMLESVLYARDHFLKPGGFVYPDRYHLYLALFSDPLMIADHVGFWQNIYGYRMTCMMTEVVKEPSVYALKPEKLCSNSCMIQTFDLNDRNSGSNSLEFVSGFQLCMTTDAEVHGFVGYFDVCFDAGLSNKICFSTRPEAPATHWKQTIFLFPQPFKACRDEVIEGKITVRRDPKDSRGLCIEFLFQGRRLTYYLH